MPPFVIVLLLVLVIEEMMADRARARIRQGEY